MKTHARRSAALTIAAHTVQKVALQSATWFLPKILSHVPTAHVKVKFGRDFVTRVVPHLCRLLVIVVLIMDVNRVVSRCGVDGVVILFKHARMG
jgi:hypothetical protein|tara:strand:+ start:271 stop:552 length:282 start_codon:yes stop_codon:yes gene_type:complete